MYPHLVKVMKERNVSKTEISKMLDLRYATVLDKFSGKSRFYYDEARKIQRFYFDDLSLEYLFENDNSDDETKAD